MAKISRNAETTKLYSASLRVAILICDVEQAMLAALMDSSEALAPKKKAGIVNPLVAELFCHKLDLLEIVGFLCTFLQHAVC